MNDIRTVFDHYCQDLTIDNRWCRAVKDFDNSFVTKNEDHVSFFGSGLIGVYPIRWLDEDRNRWIDDILQADDIGLKDDLHNLDSIDTSHRVTSDLLNLSFIYLLYRVVNSDLSTNTQNETMQSIIKIMHYKYLSSLQSHYFAYPADKEIAQSMFNGLSMRFDIKREGTWNALIKDRADKLVSSSSIHKTTIKTLRDDKGALYFITDVQSRIREVFKALTREFYIVRDSGNRIATTSSVLETNEGMVVKDVKRTYSQFYRYLEDIVPDKRDFIRDDLLQAILDTISSANPNLVRKSLEFMSDNYTQRRKKYLKELTEKTLLYGFEFLHEKRIHTSDLAGILIKFRAMLTGSRISEQQILDLRELGDKVVLDAAPKRLSYTPAAERTVVLVYILLRTLTKKRYSE